MHFGYAFLIGLAGAVLVRSWAARALCVAYPALVLLTIVATANHYLLDAIAGAVVVGLGFAAVGAWATVRGRARGGGFPSGRPCGQVPGLDRGPGTGRLSHVPGGRVV